VDDREGEGEGGGPRKKMLKLLKMHMTCPVLGALRDFLTWNTFFFEKVLNVLGGAPPPHIQFSSKKPTQRK
jgi:hypothetical protein